MLGKRLTEERKKKKLTQEETARQLGIPRSTYSNYENGKREPDLDTVKSMAEFFDVTVDWLTGMTDSRKSVANEARDIDKQILQELNRVSAEDLEYFLGLLKRMSGK